MVDTHAHLDEVQDVGAALERSRAAGVAVVVAVGSDFGSNQKALELAQEFPRGVYPALGLHPGQMGEMGRDGVQRTLEQIEASLPGAVALGEVGLDYHKRVRASADKEWQQAVLRRLLELARRHDKPALVHSRYAWADALALALQSGLDKAVFHWFTGPSSVLRAVIEAGYYISATPAVEYHEEHRRAVSRVPLERLLLETDSPVSYAQANSPERYQAQPADVARVLRAVATLRGLPEDAVAWETTANACRLFGLQPLGSSQG
ncbi:MAG: TatD family hydrolase [Chloroflexi bacterium]|nr:TatD family hydrolase [Chloroflexota bacterium]